jgi:5-methylcytosine-specific restriction endonuclease McrBC regulatory subunit McrC
LLKAEAVIRLIKCKGDEEDLTKIVDLIKKASKWFSEAGVKKGVAQCKFGLAMVYEHFWASFIKEKVCNKWNFLGQNRRNCARDSSPSLPVCFKDL